MPLENFGAIVSEVLQYGFNDGPQVNRKRIENWVGEAQFQIAREVDAPEFQETEVLTLQQGVWKYPLPASCLRVQDIYYPEMIMTLQPVDLKKMDILGPGQTESQPNTYTLYKEEIVLWPTPNNSKDTLEVRYIKNPPALTEEGSVPVLNPNYWHLLVHYALGRAFEAEDDPESAQAHIGRYAKDLAQYATDVQWRIDDRPVIVDGTWNENSSGYQSLAGW